MRPLGPLRRQTMRVLVTGASGLLGGRLATLLAERFEVLAGRHLAPGPPPLPEVALDLDSPASIARALEEARPDAVVHAAALADADRCEADPALAETRNVLACELLARLCRARSIRLIALSTDLVFDGRRPYRAESDPAEPLMTYGRTKLLGEEAVLSEAPDAAVVRLALVHGRGFGPRATASEAVAWALRAGRTLRLFTDQFRTPIEPESVAAALRVLLSGIGAGRFHLGGEERLSRHELGLRVARGLGLDSSRITAVSQAEHPLAAPRPADVSLDSGRARRELGWVPRPLEAGIAEGRTRAG